MYLNLQPVKRRHFTTGQTCYKFCPKMNNATVTLGKTEFADRETTKITTTVHNELAVSLILKSVASKMGDHVSDNLHSVDVLKVTLVH